MSTDLKSLNDINTAGYSEKQDMCLVELASGQYFVLKKGHCFVKCILFICCVPCLFKL